MERQKQATEKSSKKKKKKKKQVEEIKKLEELDQIDEEKRKTKSTTVTSIQAEDFSLISRYLGSNVTAQQLDRFKKVFNLCIELEANGAVSKMRNSLELQYGEISATTLAHNRRLETGWSNRLTRFRALKQKRQADATREEIIAKFQKALTKKKTKHLRKKERRTQQQQLPLQTIKKETTTK